MSELGVHESGANGFEAETTDLLVFASAALINLDDRPDRLADTLAALSEALGRPIEAGRDVHLIRPIRYADPAGFVKAGYRSNTHAHLQAARWAQELGHERLLVLEDDVAFGPEWQQWGPGLLADLEGRCWHLASLGYRDEWGEAPRRLDGGEAGWVRFSGQVLGAHAYLLHRTAYDEWIAHLETVLEGEPGDDLQGPMPSDGAINTFFWMGEDRVRLLAVPTVVGTRATRSDIDPSFLDRLPVVGALAEVARRWHRRLRPEGSINNE